MMITVLLVADEPLVQQGLRMWLARASDIKVIGEASNGSEALDMAQTLRPDVVLIDIAMPAADGLAATAALRVAVPHCGVVFLSLEDDALTRARAQSAGAVAFVGKQDGARTLLRAIRTAGREETASAHHEEEGASRARIPHE